MHALMKVKVHGAARVRTDGLENAAASQSKAPAPPTYGLPAAERSKPARSRALSMTGGAQSLRGVTPRESVVPHLAA